MAKKTDENDKQNLTEFQPSEKQLKLLQALLDPEVAPSVTAVCEAAGVSRVTYWEWRKNPAFCEWLQARYMEHVSKLMPHLDKIGWKAAGKNFQYFEFMQRKYGGVVGQLESGVRGAMEELGKLMYRDEDKNDGHGTSQGTD